MYDVTRPQTFKSIEKWYQLMSDHGRGDVEVALVGNKCDLNSDKKVDSKQGESTATELGCHFYESSAKGQLKIGFKFQTTSSLDNLNIENVFMGLVRNILVNMPLERPPDAAGDRGSTATLSLESKPLPSGGSCPC